ncbi:MAG: CRTAC1 family protein, partial [Planctomycetota bacterium]
MRTRLLVCVLLSVPCAGAAAQGVSFVDVTTAAGLSGEYFMPGYDIPGGGAVADFNNDGFQDVVRLGGWLGDKLFINNGNGTFTESSQAWGMNGVHRGIGVAIGDYNKDGWLDAYVTSFGLGAQVGQHKLYRNEGGTHFSDQAVNAGVHLVNGPLEDGFGAAFGDYDLDGDLDLFVGGWHTFAGNTLFENLGTGSFAIVTQAALGAVNAYSFAPRFVDMNGDFYPELLIAGDYATSQYFLNDGAGGFINYTVASGTGIDGNGMGQTVADYDGDGRLDWYVTSVHTPVAPDPIIPGTGNLLYMQQPNHTYAETSLQAGVNDGGWGWGALSIDFDHDGFVDIIETNGWKTAEWDNENSRAFRNDGTGNFSDVSVATGIATHTLQGRGIAALDYDNDGDQDVLFFANNEPMRLYRCDLTGPDRNWLRILLDTSSVATLAPNGFGSRVRVNVAGVEQLRSLDGGCNYLSQSELSVHFGLQGATVVDEVRVEWSNGVASIFENVAINQTLTLAPGAMTFVRGDCNADG